MALTIRYENIYTNTFPKKKKQKKKNSKKKSTTVKDNWIANASKEYLKDLNKRRKERINVATPPWETKENIKEFYAIAKKFGMTVDHIIPLLGDWNGVCGLHFVDNFQLMSLEDNIEKGANYRRD